MEKQTQSIFQNNLWEKLKNNATYRCYYEKIPLVSAYFLYDQEEKWKAVRDKSELTMHQIVKESQYNWNQNLSNEQKDEYYFKSKQIKNESDLKEYLNALEQKYNLKKKIKKIKQKPQSKKKQ